MVPSYPRLCGAGAVAVVLVACSPTGEAPQPYDDGGTGGYAVSYGGSAGAGAGGTVGGGGGVAPSVGEGGVAGAPAAGGASSADASAGTGADK